VTATFSAAWSIMQPLVTTQPLVKLTTVKCHFALAFSYLNFYTKIINNILVRHYWLWIHEICFL